MVGARAGRVTLDGVTAQCVAAAPADTDSLAPTRCPAPSTYRARLSLPTPASLPCPRPAPSAVNIALMMSAGFFVNGPYALITTAVSADLGTHKSLAGAVAAAGWGAVRG